MLRGMWMSSGIMLKRIVEFMAMKWLIGWLRRVPQGTRVTLEIDMETIPDMEITPMMITKFIYIHFLFLVKMGETFIKAIITKLSIIFFT